MTIPPTFTRLRCFYTKKSLEFLTIAILSFCPLLGCQQSEPIVTYDIPTEAPAAFRGGSEQMLGAMFPAEGKTWFFKVSGPQTSIKMVESDLKNFVKNVKFIDGNPDLAQLPEGWRIASNKPMRFASINIDTPEKQLDLSVSSLSTQADWDAEVLANVNRWRNQFGFSPSAEKWAEAEAIEVAVADKQAVWVDLTIPAAGGKPLAAAPPMVDVIDSKMPNDDIHSGLAMPAATPKSTPAAQASSAENDSDSDSKIKYVRPDGWRDGRMLSMRLAAFNVGPEDAQAEITIIPAGGDLRGNVARWLGQIRPSGASEDVVDKALQDAEKIEVDGRESQRFILIGDESEGKTTSIDATIVPLEDGFSLFIKMTGPAETVAEQYEATKSFIQSLEL